MKVLRSFPFMVELSVLEKPDGEFSCVYLVRSSNGQPIKFCFSDEELVAFVSELHGDVIDEVKQSDSQK